MTNTLSPTARRSTDNALCEAYSRASAEMALAGRAEEALACQWVGDVHKVMAALWSKAANSNDPTTSFFELASQAMAAADRARPATNASSAAGALSSSRGAWVAAAREMNIPLVFRSAAHLGPLGPVDLERAGAALTEGLSAGEYLQARGATAGGLGRAAQVAVLSYLAQVSDQTGDTARVTALAAWSLMQMQGVRSDDATEVKRVAREVLGPVGWVRVGPYLEYAAAL